MSRRRTYNSFVIISLLYQIYEQVDRLPYKPPVTLFFLALNIATFLFPIQLFSFRLWDVSQNCLFPQKILSLISSQNYFGFLNRLILSSIIHVDEQHLYYNMISFLIKGIQLEQLLGSFSFLQLVLYSILASHSIMVLLSAFLTQIPSFESHSGFYSCAVGFSAVIFSLKYVLYMRSSGNIHVMYFTVNIKYAAWAELVLISLLNPNASFVGHLSGILAGMLYHHYLPHVPSWFAPARIPFDESRPRFSSIPSPNSNVERRGWEDFGSSTRRGVSSRDGNFSPEPTLEPLTADEIRRRRIRRYS